MFKKLIALCAALAGLIPNAPAQRIDLAVLAGAAFSHTDGGGASLITVSTRNSVAAQANLSVLLAKPKSGELFAELPVVAVPSVSVGVDASSLRVTTTHLFITPGVRYEVNLRSRITPYVAGGVGLVRFGGAELKLDPSYGISITSQVKPAIGFGGGVNVRLTPRIALRTEIRDFVALGSNVAYRHRPVLAAGLAFRF